MTSELEGLIKLLEHKERYRFNRLKGKRIESDLNM